jgi:ferric-dicitrate binding protein FerR (iron transport regulator)
MAFDNVTLFEITVEDPFASEPDERAGESIDATEAPATEAETGGGRGRKLLALVLAGAALALAAWWALGRRGEDEADFETEEVEPGVERVEA